MKAQRPRIDKVVLSKKRNSWGITTPDLKLYYREILIQTIL
jgi:hypothetical protein